VLSVLRIAREADAATVFLVLFLARRPPSLLVFLLVALVVVCARRFSLTMTRGWKFLR